MVEWTRRLHLMLHDLRHELDARNGTPPHENGLMAIHQYDYAMDSWMYIHDNIAPFMGRWFRSPREDND